MSDNLNNEELEANTNEPNAGDEGKGKLTEEHQAMLKALVDEELKNIKAKLDGAYKKLEESEKEKVRLQEETRKAKHKRLEDEGKHLEAANLRLAELEEQVRIKEENLTRLARDRELDRVLGNLDFRNDFAKETAFNTILRELVQDEDGSWVHRSGASLTDYVKAFVKDPNKDFLFKPKENTGVGTSNNKAPAGKVQRPASLKGLSTEELLRLASSGQLGKTF